MEVVRNIAITSADLSSRYLSYLPLASVAYKRINKMELILVLNLGQDFTKRIIEFCEPWANIRVLPLVKGVDHGVQAKISRMWVAATEDFKNSRITLCDLDMIQLDDVRSNIISSYPNESLIQWGYDHPSYLVEPDIGKWPMDGTTASGATFRNLVNPNEKTLVECFLDWSASKTFDKRSNPFNGFGNFSDESLLKDLLIQAQFPPIIQKISRLSFETRMLGGRIDRGARAPIFPKRYFRVHNVHEYHGPRPFQHETRIGRQILELLGLTQGDYKEFSSELHSLLDL